jgi:glutamine synthetase
LLAEELVFVATCDMSGHVRGKGFPARELPARLSKGVGWTHSNIMMSAFGPIFDTPFGTGGDLMIVPDRAAEARVDFGDGLPAEHVFLGDLRNTDGTYWECCPRNFLRRALDALEQTGLRMVAAFEHEFTYTGNEDRPGDAYALGAFRRAAPFGSAYVAAMRQAGLDPDSFLAEYGPRQFEVTVGPRPALQAADHAVLTREMARATALRHGARAIFSPKLDPDGVGNGVHIHMSFRNLQGRPVTHSPKERFGLSRPAQSFFAGVLHHLPAICAVTAPSPVSYLRLMPNRWAPTSVDIVQQDRGASLRVCPIFGTATPAERAAQYNVEYRTADATASPYLALGAIVFAGLDGLRREMALPEPGQPSPALPQDLATALDNLVACAPAREWFGAVHLDAYLRHKRAELTHVQGLTPAGLCDRYAEVY